MTVKTMIVLMIFVLKQIKLPMMIAEIWWRNKFNKDNFEDINDDNSSWFYDHDESDNKRSFIDDYNDDIVEYEEKDKKDDNGGENVNDGKADNSGEADIDIDVEMREKKRIRMMILWF